VYLIHPGNPVDTPNEEVVSLKSRILVPTPHEEDHIGSCYWGSNCNDNLSDSNLNVKWKLSFKG
jgi:hypothetical protein